MKKARKPTKPTRSSATKRPRREPSVPQAPLPAATLAPEPQRPKKDAFPIVGIGASAGGLEALEEFLKNVPPSSGMAYVVVQHLDPKHKGAMVELLQRATKMPVAEVRDRQKVERDCVYVIPPNKDMSSLHGVLHLLPQAHPHHLNLPIDFFFRSLAEDQQERSIGVVLSGMGSDGTLGLRAIKEKAGAAFVQSPESAKFSAMPGNVIEAGLADVVASPKELPARIVAYREHTPYVREAEGSIQGKQLTSLEKVFILVRSHTGNDFSLYKRSTILRRVERRMGLHQIDKIDQYVRYLRENPREIELLFNELLIGVTNFFRDPQAWDHLRKDALPELLRTRVATGPVRVWVPGCSTGEEAYSLAILLSETLGSIGSHVAFQIFATDLDRDAIEKARQGIYPTNIAADVSLERLRRFFLQDERGYRVRKEIRESVVFAPQNIIMDPPFTKLDILSCRNLLIYLSPELHKKLVPLFHYALNPGGVLFLGSAETVGTYTSLFRVVEGKSRIYQRLSSGVALPPVDFPPALSVQQASPAHAEGERSEPRIAPTPSNFSVLADRAILQRLSPAAVLTNDKGDLLYVSGRIGKYLEPAAGKANLNVFAMAREGLRYELSAMFAAALRQDGPVTVRAPRVQTNGSYQAIDLTVQRLAEPKELSGMVLLSFTEAPPAPPTQETQRSLTKARILELEQEMHRAREEVQTTREEMQTSQEELKSTNEELQSTNEELQSTNEELTTSKEEMQSMNEELQTVNQELQSKVDELSRSSNDMKNLLNSTDIATLFLDGELNVRRFTNPTAKLIKLIPADAGRPITDIATDLKYPSLADDAHEVLRTLIFKETEIESRDNRWFSVRIMPYRTIENVIDGVVITFSDITASKMLESTLREQADQLEQMSGSLRNLVWGCRPDGACDFVGLRWVEYTGVPEAEQLGYGWLGQVRPDMRDRVRDSWKAAITAHKPLDIEFPIRRKDGEHRWFNVQLVPIHDSSGSVLKWYCSATDVDDLKKASEQSREARERLSSMMDAMDEAVIGLDEGLRVIVFNVAAERMFGGSRGAVLGKPVAEVAEALRSGPKGLLDVLREVERDRAPASRKVGGLAIRVTRHAHGMSVVCNAER